MHATASETDIQSATLAGIAVGQVSIGPITVSELVVQDVALQLNAGVGVVHGMTVTLRLRLDFEWHIHVPLPWPFDDIDIGDTDYLGTYSFGLPAVGDVVIPGLNNLNLSIPSLTAHGVTAIAEPLTNVQVSNAVAQQIQARDVVLPTAGFTLAGLALGSVEADQVSVPAAGVRQATVNQVRADPLHLGSLALDGVTVGSATVPSLRNTSPFDVPANLQPRKLPFDLGLLTFSFTITPSATAHIPSLEITNSNATASTGRITVHDVTLPFEALNLTLSQIGINSIGIPAFSVA